MSELAQTSCKKEEFRRRTLTNPLKFIELPSGDLYSAGQVSICSAILRRPMSAMLNLSTTFTSSETDRYPFWSRSEFVQTRLIKTLMMSGMEPLRGVSRRASSPAR